MKSIGLVTMVYLPITGMAVGGFSKHAASRSLNPFVTVDIFNERLQLERSEGRVGCD